MPAGGTFVGNEAARRPQPGRSPADPLASSLCSGHRAKSPGLLESYRPGAQLIPGSFVSRTLPMSESRTSSNVTMRGVWTPARSRKIPIWLLEAAWTGGGRWRSADGRVGLNRCRGREAQEKVVDSTGVAFYFPLQPANFLQVFDRQMDRMQSP